MEKETEPNIKNRLRVGDQIFYYDGYTAWNIEEVVEINKAEKSAILSNNAHISRFPKADGTFERLNPTKSIIPKRDKLTIKRATPELIKLRTAIMAKKKIAQYMFRIEQDIMNKADLNLWDRWSNHLQDELINVCGHLAKAMEEEPLTEEEINLINSVIESEEVKPKEIEAPVAPVEEPKTRRRKRK